MQFHFRANQSHFHKNGFALRLALNQRHKETRKWPILDTKKYSSILVTMQECARSHNGYHAPLDLTNPRQKKKSIIETVMEWSAVPAGLGRRELGLATT